MKSLTDVVADHNTPVSQILTAVRVVAARAGVPDLADWASREAGGYANDDELPAHRTWRLTVTASLLNPYRGILSNVDIGTVAFPEQFREATIYRCLDGVGDLETLLRGIGPEPTPLSAEYPDLASLVNSSRMTNEAWKCVKATALFSPVHLMNIVTKARQTALTLCLECESKGIELRWLGNEDDESGSYRQWLRTLRDENAKEAIRTVWTGLRKALFAAVEHYGS